jgi:hypothetical protein
MIKLGAEAGVIDGCFYSFSNLIRSGLSVEQACKTVMIIPEREGSASGYPMPHFNDAVKSRCKKIDYDFNDEDLREQKENFIAFAVKVCNAENIEYDNLGMKMLFQYVFPDFRQFLILLDDIKSSNEKITSEYVKNLTESSKTDEHLYELILNPKIQGEDLYSEIVKYRGKEKEAFLALGEPFFNYINEKGNFEKTLNASSIVAENSHKYVITINKFSTLLSCVVQLKTLFR